MMAMQYKKDYWLYTANQLVATRTQVGLGRIQPIVFFKGAYTPKSCRCARLLYSMQIA